MYENQVVLLTNTLNTIKESIENYKNNMEKEFETIANKTKDTTVSSLEGAHLIQEIRANLRSLHLKFVEYVKKLKTKLESDETYKERINYKNINLGLIFSKISYWSKINDLLHKGIIYNINFKENLDNLKNDLESINLKIPTDIKVDSFINGKVKYNGETIEQILDRNNISKNQSSIDTKTLVNDIDNVMNMNTIKINQTIEKFYNNLINDLKDTVESEPGAPEPTDFVEEPEPDYDDEFALQDEDEPMTFYDEEFNPKVIDGESINHKLKELYDEIKTLQDNSSFNSKLNIISDTLELINDKLQFSENRDKKIDRQLQDITNLNSIMFDTNKYITSLENRLSTLEKSTNSNNDEQRAILTNLIGEFNRSIEDLKTSSMSTHKVIGSEILNKIGQASNDSATQFENLSHEINNLLSTVSKHNLKDQYKELINELKSYIDKLTNVDEIYNYITTLISSEVVKKLDDEHSRAFQLSIVEVMKLVEEYKTAAINETRVVLKEKDDQIITLLQEKKHDERERVRIIKEYTEKMFKYIKDVVDKNDQIQAQSESNIQTMVNKLESYNQNLNIQINKILSKTNKANVDVKKLIDDYKINFSKKTEEILNYIKENEKSTFEKLNSIEDMTKLTAFKQRVISKELNKEEVEFPGMRKRTRHM